MTPAREEDHRALKRMLANGPMTALPKRPADEALLARLAAGRFEPGREYTEGEVNEELERWLGTFCAPYGIDHVTMRRLLVDSRLLARDKSGSTYRVNETRREAPGLEPASVLEEVRRERAARKRGHAA